MHEKYPEGKSRYREFSLGTVHALRRLIEFLDAGEVRATLEHRNSQDFWVAGLLQRTQAETIEIRTGVG